LRYWPLDTWRWEIPSRASTVRIRMKFKGVEWTLNNTGTLRYTPLTAPTHRVQLPHLRG
jgi:hypothetical protein